MRRSAKARSAAEAPPSSRAAPRALSAFVFALLLLTALQLASAALPGAWLWGAGVQRFLPRAVAAALGALMAVGLALILAPAAQRIGERLRVRPVVLGMALAVALPVLCFNLPDRTFFTGDFIYRQGAVAGQHDAARVLPQALPLDLWLHHTLPVQLGGDVAKGGHANEAGRLIGAVDAALWGAAAAAVAWGLGLEGAAGLAVAALVAFGAALTLFTGYNKAFAELAVAVLAAGACAARVARDGRGLVPLAAITAFAILLHRSGLALLPLWATACLVAMRGGEDRRPVRGAALAIAAVLPLATLALSLPRIVAAMKVLDARHLAPAEVQQHGLFAATFAPAHLLELFNAVLWIAPLAAMLPVLAIGAGAAFWRRRDALLIAALVVPAAGWLLFIHPIQGVFRDIDVFVPAGAALAVASAWLAADALRGRGGLALGAAVLAVALGIGPVLHLANPDRGYARIRSWLTGPPTPPASVASGAWNFLGWRAMVAQRWSDASVAFEHSATLAPNPRYIMEWGAAESAANHHRKAQELYARSVALNPDLPLGWLGLATSSTWLGDTAAVRRALGELKRLEPGNAQIPDLEEFLRRSQGPAGR